MPIRVLIVTGTPYGSAARTVAARIIASRSPLVGQRGSPALAGHLGHRAAEVEVDVTRRAYSVIRIRVASAMIIGSTP